MNSIQRLLEDTFHETGWDINLPSDGWEKTSFIASLKNKKYFIKLGINPDVMLRLSEIRVTSTVLKTGILDGEYYMIQEFIKGVYVPKEWLLKNPHKLTSIILKYQNDIRLKEVIQKNMPAQYLTIDGELDDLLSQITPFPSSKEHSDVIEGINNLKTRYKKLQLNKLVPVHDDPNTKNIFLQNEELLMIDWNKIRLSDSFSDIGAILWWYIPSEKWNLFLKSYGVQESDEILERVYLAAAKMSMGFTIWNILHKKNYKDSFNDFRAAIAHKDNPRAWYADKKF